MTRTRTRLALVCIALLAVTSAAPPALDTASAARHSFVVEQGNRCFEVSPLRGNQNVAAFYDYRTTENTPDSSYSSYMPRHLTRADASRMFLYEGPDGVSLVIVHNTNGGDHGDGSAATFRFRNLPGGGGWVVQDDDYAGQDDRFSRNRIDWAWYGDRTDGAAFRGLDRSGIEITVAAAFDGNAALYDDLDRTGNVRAWQFLTGSLGDPSAIGLDPSRPLTLRTGNCNRDTTDPRAYVEASDGVVGYAVTLDATGATDENGIVEYRWDFDGDGQVDDTSSSPVVEHTYSGAGTYEARVTVADAAGNTDTASDAVRIESDDPPAAAFDLRGAPTAGLPVTLDARNATDEVGIAEYRWDFDGDGQPESTTTDPSASHAFEVSGSHTVTLTVVDPRGHTDTVTRNVSVDADDPPEAAFEVVSPEKPVTGEQVVLDASNSTDDTGVATYRWSFGGNATATGERVTHAFDEEGPATVTLEVVDEGGNTATKRVRVKVLPPDVDPPKAATAEDRRRVEAGANVTLDATPSTDNRNIVGYRWEFGDGTGGSAATVTHAYDAPGTYNATVFVTDGGGNTTNGTVTVEVLRPRPPNVTASVPDRVVVDEPFEVSGSATDGASRISRYRWTFGEGGPTETGRTVSHTFDEVGNYTVSLTAVDGSGHANTTSAEVRVLPPDETPPTAALSINTNETRTGREVTFDAGNSTDLPHRDVRAYRWDFDGDGETDRVTETPTVGKTYGSKGTYNATVTVVDGGNNTANATVTVRVKPERRANRGGGNRGGRGGGSSGGGGPPPIITERERTGPNSGLVDVRNGRDDEPVRSDLPATQLADETGVRFRGVVVDLADDDAHFVVETARPADGTPPADVTLGTLAVGGKYVTSRQVERVTYDVAIETTRLEAADLAPADLTAYQRSGDAWEPVNATVRERGDVVVVRVETDALAPVAVGANRSATLADASLAATEVAADEPVSVTATVRNEGSDSEEFAVNLTADGEVVAAKTVAVPAGETREVAVETDLPVGTHAIDVNGRQVGSVTVVESVADLRVTDVSVNASSVASGEQVAVTATVENRGNAAGEKNVTLTIAGKAVATKTASVLANGTSEVTFVTTVTEAGTYTATVGNESARLEVTAADETTTPGGDGPSTTSGGDATTHPGDGDRSESVVPGFGVTTALVGLAAAVLLVLRRR